MQQKPIWIWAAGAVFAALVLFTALRPQGITSSDLPRPGSPNGTIEITMTSSTTKKEWLDEQVRAFNAASQSTGGVRVDNKAVLVKVLLEELEPGRFEHYRSGTQVDDTLQGKIKPTIVSPADDSWIAKLRKEWTAMRRSEIATAPSTSLARTPVVIAMWQSRARALGCWPTPEPECTWARIRALARSSEGWGLLGHPEWGQFKFGNTYVGVSDVGTQTAILLCMAGIGKGGTLAIEDVDAGNGCGQAIADVERAKVHSSKLSPWLLGLMLSGGPEYLDALTTYEKEVIAFNQANAGKLREPVVAVYPQDGTVVVGHPMAILDGADWVSTEQAEAARIFQTYLLSDEAQRALPRTGMRPANPGTPIGPPIDPGYGANPAVNLVAVTVPDLPVYDRVIEVWHRVKKHAAIALVFDKSGSMAGGKITAAVKGAQEFVRRVDRDDRIIWMPFDATVYSPTEGYGSELGEELAQRIGSTVAGGGTSLYDAVLTAYDRLERLRRDDPTGMRYGIVVLSDGQDTNSRNGLSDLERKLRPAEGDATGIQIHTIAIGTDADQKVLQRIAGAAHGRFWKGQTENQMVTVYQDIAAFF